MITLEQDRLRAQVDPLLGAGVLSLDARVGDTWIPLFAQAPDLPVASFLMVPWSNRVANGRFTFAGRSVQLDEPERHAIHGVVRKRPWEVVTTAPTSVTLRFDWPGGAWPWPFVAEARYRLDGDCFLAELAVTNRADSPMPAGLGFHPYFTRGDAVVGFRVAGIYPDANDTRIPSGPAEPVDARRDFATPRALDPAAFMDFCAHGWDGVASIRWPARGVGVDIRSDLDHLVFFNPPKPYFALEPVSNSNDGFNLLHLADSTSGVRILQPGETLRSGVMSIERAGGSRFAPKRARGHWAGPGSRPR